MISVSELPDLSLNQWVVLAIVAEKPTHGFAIATLVGARGELGQVWTITRPLVYRALDDLLRLRLVEPMRTEPGANNVNRRIVAATAMGQTATRLWLDQPVEHLRDVRSVLLAKLAFLDRAERSPRALLQAEQQRVAVLVDGLRSHAALAGSFSGTVVRWRVFQAESIQRFLDDELSRAGRRRPPPE